MPIMNAAKAPAAQLTGEPPALVFPLMQGAVKTTALPIVVAAPHPATQGQWLTDAAAPTAEGDGWRIGDAKPQIHGFVL